MPRTKRDLYLLVASKIGGTQGHCMRATLRQYMYGALFREKLTEDEFASQLRQAEVDLPYACAQFFQVVQEKAGSFSFGGAN